MSENFKWLINKKLDSYNIEELHKNGIIKERFLKSFSSHIVVTYPPLSILPKINPDKIFSKSNEKPFTLYLHIPFCTGKCLYCGFSTYAHQKEERIEEYLSALKKEMLLYLEKTQVKKAKIKSVYIGGGTPTILSINQLKDLIDFIHNNFELEKNAEFTIESSPETITKEKLKILLDQGVNRLNIGIQTFDDNILKLLLRRHNSKEAITAYNLAKSVGFDNINIDLMRGLPDMDFNKTMKDLEIIKKLNPESITSYDLLIKPSTGIKLLYSKEPRRFLGDKERLLIHLGIIEKLKEIGYIQNPVDWFTKSKVYKQQIQKWEEMINSLSFGVSSYSYVNNIQYVNTSNVLTYLDLIKKEILPIESGEELSKSEQLNRAFVFGFKTKINKSKIIQDFGKIPKEMLDKINKLKSLGLIEEEGNILKLSEKGDLFANEICTQFYSGEINRRLKKE